MKAPKNIEELRSEFKALKGGWSRDTIFMAKAMMFFCELAVKQSHKPQRKKSAWQLYMTKRMREGATLRDAAAEWSQRHSK